MTATREAELLLLVIADPAGEPADVAEELTRSGYPARGHVVSSVEALETALAQRWDAAISGFQTRGLGWSDALKVVRRRAPLLPFILYAGEIGGEAALAAIRGGASDFVRRGNPARLAQAIAAAPCQPHSSRLYSSRKVVVEQALLEHEASLQKAEKMASLGYWEVDLPGRQTRWSAGQCAIFGFAPGEASPDLRLLISMVHPYDRERFTRGVQERLLRGLPLKIDYRIVRRDGTLRYVRSETDPPFLDSAGRPVKIFGITQDITSLKLADKALKDSEEKFRSIVEQSCDGILIIDQEGFIVECNRGNELITGLSREDTVGEKIWDYLFRLLPSEAKAADTLDQLKGGLTRMLKDSSLMEPYKSPYQDLDRPDGTRRTIQTILFPIQTSRGVFLGSIARDVTEQRQIEKQLELERLELKRSNEELEQFAYVASHDLQEPLRMVAGYVKLLDRRYRDKLDPDARDYLNYASDGAARMQQMITDLLQYSRVSTRGKPPEPTDLEEVFKTVLLNLDLAISESRATVTHTPLPVVKADSTQVMHVLQNLLSNALKFRKPDVQPVLGVSARRAEGMWEISVSDNGIGIDPEYYDRLFVIFQRLHSRKDYPGNGIGLAICKKIVERHGGRIWVESKPGEGSTFKFTLPAADEKADSTG